MANVTDTYYQGDAFIGYGAQLKVGQNDGSPESFVAVADIVSITPGNMTTGIVEKTHLRSPGRHREKLATIRDSGPFKIMANYRPSHGSQNNNPAGGDGFAPGRSLLQLWRNVTEANFEIVFIQDPVGGSPSGEDVLSFRGVVTSFQPGGIALDTKVDLTVEITPLHDFSAGMP